MGIKHRVISPSGDESFDASLTPAEIVKTLSYKKASDVVSTVLSGLVIGADTIVVVDDQVLGKPQDPEHAKRMLRRLQGKQHSVYTGVTVIDAVSGQHLTDVANARVSMRTLTSAEIDSYVQTEEPLDKAGAYSIQGLGAVFVDSVSGDFYAVVGLSLVLAHKLLSAFGYDIFATD